MNKNQAIAKAAELGAIEYNFYWSDKLEFHETADSKSEEYAYASHFFDKHGREICYFIESLGEHGFKELEIPRVWSKEFKENKRFSKRQLIGS